MFNVRDHIITLQGKEYLEVKWRVAWFREENPLGAILTEETAYEPGMSRVKATIIIDGSIVSTGMAVADSRDNPKAAIWRGKELMKAETSAIGRALAHAGYGTQFTGEDEGDFLADSPVEQKQPEQKTKQKQTDDNKPQPGQKQGNGDNKWHGNFVEWCNQDNVMGNASIKEIVEAMNNSLVTRVKLPEIADYTIAHLGMMPHDKEHATAAIIAWKAGYDADNIDVAIESVFNMDNKSEEDRERIHNLYNQSVRFAIANANRHFGEVEF